MAQQHPSTSQVLGRRRHAQPKFDDGDAVQVEFERGGAPETPSQTDHSNVVFEPS